MPCGLQSHPTLAITCAGNALNDSISWPGYQQVAMEHCSPGRVNQGQKIFAPPLQVSTTARLLKLGELRIWIMTGWLRQRGNAAVAGIYQRGAKSGPVTGTG